MALAAALLAGSTLLSAYSQYQSGESERQSILDSIYDMQLQKFESRRRNERNMELMRGQTEDIISQQQLAFAAGNVAVNSGASFQAQTDALNTFVEEALNLDMENRYNDLVTQQSSLSMGRKAYQVGKARDYAVTGTVAQGAIKGFGG